MRVALLASIGSLALGSAWLGGGCRHGAPPPEVAGAAASAQSESEVKAFAPRIDASDEAMEAWLFPSDDGVVALRKRLLELHTDGGKGAEFTLPSFASQPLLCAVRLLGSQVKVNPASPQLVQTARIVGGDPDGSFEADTDAARVGDRDANDDGPADGAGDGKGDDALAVTLGSAAAVDPEARCAGEAILWLDAAKNDLDAHRYAEALGAIDAHEWSTFFLDDAQRCRARALDGLERRSEAAAAWQKLATGRGPRVQEACVRAARDLVTLGTPGAGTAARGLLLRAFEEAPAWAESQEGLGPLLAEASRLAKEKPERELLSRAKESQAWHDAGEGARAKRVAHDVVRKAPAGAGEAACRARTVLAQEAAKGQKAADWGHAIDACAGTELEAAALFSGAKASFAEKKSDEAAHRYDRLAQGFPGHRLADDAALALGKILLEQGLGTAAEEKFASVAARHPSGDMVPEATFKAALLRVQRGAIAEAKSLVEDVTADDADVHWSSGGRGRHLRALCNERLGDVAAAKRDYTEVIQRHPYSFWMLAAHARLRNLAPTEARVALETLENAPYEPFAPLTDEALLLAREAYLAGRSDILRDLAAYGAFGSRPKEVGWAFSWLLNAAGMETLGHGRPRSQAPQFLGHAPHGMARLGWMGSFPTPYGSRVRAEAGKRSVPASLVWAVMREESAFKAEVKSSAKAYGLMQLIVPTAKLMARGEGISPTEHNLVDPAVNVALGTKLLGVLRKGYAANPVLAIPAYNAGGGAVNRWLEARRGLPFELWVESIPYEETKGYVKRVTTSWMAYARLYDPEELGQILAQPWPDAAPMGSAADAP